MNYYGGTTESDFLWAICIKVLNFTACMEIVLVCHFLVSRFEFFAMFAAAIQSTEPWSSSCVISASFAIYIFAHQGTFKLLVELWVRQKKGIFCYFVKNPVKILYFDSTWYCWDCVTLRRNRFGGDKPRWSNWAVIQKLFHWCITFVFKYNARTKRELGERFFYIVLFGMWTVLLRKHCTLIG